MLNSRKKKYVMCLETLKTGFFSYFSENWLSKHLQTGVCSFWEEVSEYPEQQQQKTKPQKHGRKVWSWENRGENINLPRGSDNFCDRKVHFTSQRFFSATVTLPTHFTVNSFEGKEKECLKQTHVMEMSVQSIRIAEAGSKAPCHKVYNR